MAKATVLLVYLLINAGLASAQTDAWRQGMNAANALQLAGDYRSAADVLRESIKAAERSGAASDRLLPSALNALGLNYEERGLFADAVPVYERALAILERTRGRENVDYANVLGNLSAVYVWLKQPARAENMAREAVAIQTRTGHTDDVSIAVARSTLSQLLVEEGRWVEAAPLIEQDLALFERLPDAGADRLAMALNNLGVIRQHQGRHQEALELLMRALQGFENMVGTFHPLLIQSLNNLAVEDVYLKRPEEAERNYKRALDIAASQLPATSPVYSQVAVNYAEFLRRVGRKREAARLKSLAAAVSAENHRINGIGMTVTASSLQKSGRK